jgi:hypothetical protein
MVHDLSQQVDNTSATGPRQAVAGLTPPQLGEGMIREAWPTVHAFSPRLTRLSQKLIRTVVLAPLGWLLVAPLFFLKVAPFVGRRYTLTNRRLMVRRGWKLRPVQEIALEAIDDVRLDPATLDPWYFAGDLEVLSGGKVALRLAGVPEPEGFRHAVINAVKAWVPGKATGPFVPASAVPAAPAPAKA